MKFDRYLLSLNNSIYNRNGPHLALYLDVFGTQCLSAWQGCQKQRTFPEAAIREQLLSPWDEVVVHLFNCQQALDQGDLVLGYEEQAAAVVSFNRIFAEEPRWILPVAYTLNRNVYRLAGLADRSLTKRGLKADKLEDAGRLLNRGFTLCATDRGALSVSRKWGTYYMVGLLFKTYFRLKTYNLCTTLIRTMKMAELPHMDEFPRAHQVTFKYYQGLLRFYHEDFSEAERHFRFAFEHCHYKHRANKERVLVYLIPTMLHRGILPKTTLLARYPRLNAIYQPFVQALRTGDIKAFDNALVHNEHTLLRQGTYLALEQARKMAVRTLFKKTYLVCNKTSRLPFSNFQAALAFVGMRVPLAEVECMLAGMIYSNLVRGYLSHDKQMLVLSIQNPFPKLQ
ncbi:COP9 signalosome (CSN) subunit [Dispira simplex]|nr:COP9 signalosome (CSN) subunit [Dispira simplex]